MRFATIIPPAPIGPAILEELRTLPCPPPVSLRDLAANAIEDTGGSFFRACRTFAAVVRGR